MQARWTFSILLALAFSGPDPASAQGPAWRGEGEWGPRAQYQRLYDPGTVETIRGTVVSVDTFSLRQHGRPGLHLHVLRARDTQVVHLGPLWFVENQELALAAKDSVIVKGSRVNFNGRPVIIAAEVIRGEETFTLRDARGFPAWSAGRRRNSSEQAARPRN